MSRLKIGVLTFHRCINYGSFWQAKCLADGLRAFGHDVNILDHTSKRINISEWKCGFQPLLPSSVPEKHKTLYREKMKLFFAAFQKLPLSLQFSLEDPGNMEDYDIVIVGSDEVWNLSHPWYGRHGLFYGDHVQAKKLISYAASFGNYDSSLGLDSHWIQKLERFDRISVRDENSRTIITNGTGREPSLVLDPCLQFHILPEYRNNYSEDPYIAIYGHNFSCSFKYHVTEFARRNKLKTISIGYSNDWVDEEWINADPHDFAHFIGSATSVATNFFHGCIFSIRNNKPFVCESSSYRSNKINGLMNKIGGQMHIANEATSHPQFEELLSAPIHGSVYKSIARLRSASNEYLVSALTLNKMMHDEIS